MEDKLRQACEQDDGQIMRQASVKDGRQIKRQACEQDEGTN